MAAEYLAIFCVGGPNLGFQDVAFLSWFSITFLKFVVEVMSSGLPQVCKLRLGVSKGILTVKHLAKKNPVMAINYCGRQLPTIKRQVQPIILERESLAAV